jgi:SpoIIAA-like
VTRADYESVLVPAVTEALRTRQKVRLSYETGRDFSLDLGAAWEDSKIGMESLTRWERVAVVTDVDWIKTAVRFFAFLSRRRRRCFHFLTPRQRERGLPLD